jgi:predicted DsbA family dithiol-disulfide isomerase
MRLAERLGVDRAPFFVVERDGAIEVYTVYLRFVNEVLKAGGAGLPLRRCA